MPVSHSSNSFRLSAPQLVRMVSLRTPDIAMTGVGDVV
jgi:hypothetical protein